MSKESEKAHSAIDTQNYQSLYSEKTTYKQINAPRQPECLAWQKYDLPECLTWQKINILEDDDEELENIYQYSDYDLVNDVHALQNYSEEAEERIRNITTLATVVDQYKHKPQHETLLEDIYFDNDNNIYISKNTLEKDYNSSSELWGYASIMSHIHNQRTDTDLKNRQWHRAEEMVKKQRTQVLYILNTKTYNNR